LRAEEAHTVRLRRALSQSVLYQRTKFKGSGSLAVPQLAVLESVSQVIQRSELCPPHPRVEARLQEIWDTHVAHELKELDIDAVQELGNQSLDLITALITGWTRQSTAPYSASPINEFDDEIGTGSRRERPRWSAFQNNNEGVLSRWVHPQVFLNMLSEQAEANDFRRVDFLIYPPWHAPLVWEVHGEFSDIDQEKDRDVRGLGIESFNEIVGQTTNEEINNKITSLSSAPERVLNSKSFNYLLDAAWVAGQVDLGLFALLGIRTWSLEQPVIQISVPEGFEEIAGLAAQSFIELVKGCEQIWSVDGTSLLIDPSMSVSNNTKPDLVLRIDPHAPPYLSADQKMASDLEIRRIFLPVDAPPWHPWKTGEALDGVRPPKSPPEESLTPLVKRCFDHETLRTGQYRGIVAAMTGVDSLILLPTGHGKSLIFQIAALVLPGATLVVEAWRALIDDQVRVLQDRGFSRIVAIHKGRQLHGDLLSALIIYVAPERLYVESFQKPLNQLFRQVGLDLLVIDEAHAVSEAGHSFRPSYLGLVDRIAERAQAASRNRPPTLALTATAANIVIRDIGGILNIKAPPITLVEETTGRAFVRENLLDEIIEVSSSEGDAGIKRSIDSVFADSRCEGQGIVYCMSKGNWATVNRPNWFGVKGTLPYVEQTGRSLSYYTGGDSMSSSERTEQADAFVTEKASVMVATAAFGAGIDLPEIRWIINLGLPAGIEAYYQQLGRAGRDGKTAIGFLIVDADSNDVHEKLINARQEADSFDSLRSVISNRRDSGLGSIARQLSLLVSGNAGNTVFDHQSPHDLEQPPPNLFMPSFPGWKYEANTFDKPLVLKIFQTGSRRQGEINFHTTYDQFVWKAINRARVLGLISGSYRRTFSLHGLNTFKFVTEDLEQACQTTNLEVRLHDFIGRLRGYRVGGDIARKVALELEQKASPKGKLGLCVRAMLLNTYEAVRDSRLGSLDGLRTYYRTTDQSERHQLIEDYFAQDDFQKEIANLCEAPPTPENWQIALDLTQEEQRSRIGVFQRLTEDLPGNGLPSFLLLIGLLADDRLEETSLPINNIFSGGQIPKETRQWVWRTLMNDLGASVSENAKTAFARILLSSRRNDGSAKSLYLTLLEYMGKSYEDEAVWHISLAKWIEDALEKE
jgi:RecQ family ATP-dependent DNA helicase